MGKSRRKSFAFGLDFNKALIEKSVSKDESKDEKSESKDEKSESNDEKSESNDEKSESKDEKSESKDEKSESKDEIQSKSKDEHVDTPSVEDKNIVETIEIQKVVGSTRRRSFAFGLDFNKALIEVNKKCKLFVRNWKKVSIIFYFV